MPQALVTSPLRVVHIISGLGQGGAETVLYRLVTASAQENDNQVICFGGPGVFGPRLEAAGVTVHYLHMRRPWSIVRGLLRLPQLIRRLQPDVVQTWMYHADVLGGLAAKRARVPVIAWGIRNSGDNLQQSSLKARIMASLGAKLSRRVPTHIIACAHNAARRHKQWGYAAEKMQVVPNGYDFSVWRAASTDGNRTAVREEWGIQEGQIVYGAVARWNPLKDHANLLAAFAEVIKQQPSARCVLIGEGLDTTNHELMLLLTRFQLHEQVLLLGRREDIPRLMSGLDTYVLSSKAEGFPNVVCEAMAAGVSCVVTDVGDAALIVGEYGTVVPPRNAHALAMGMLAASSAQALHGERLEQARQRIEQLFSLATMVNTYDRIWRGQIVAPSGADSALSHPSLSTTTGSSAQGRLLMVVNNPAFFMSHRVGIALTAQKQGYDVHIATMPGPAVAQIQALGLTHHAIKMSRSGKNPLQELRTVWNLYGLFRQLRPDLVHAVTIKPVLYGGIAARLARVPAFVAAISGLGYVFMRARGGVMRRAAIWLYRLALAHRHSRVIFQNHSDRDVLLRARVVRAEQVVMIRGSGVDLQQFYPVEPPATPPVVVTMVSRLLADKGVREFMVAAQLTAKAQPAIEWRLVGSVDPANPASLQESEIKQWQAEGWGQYLGERSDIAQLYQQSHIAVLPSYREGLPKSLVEAAAAGLPVVTTDVPGCRDAIEPDRSGLLVPPKDAQALANAVLRLANDPAQRTQMGHASRLLAEQAFDIRKINEQHLQIYQSLLSGVSPKT